MDFEKAVPFIKQLYYVKEFGIPPWACFTHAVHESGHFKRVIGENNYFGIKPPRRWAGTVHRIPTHEFVDGKKVPMVCEFADWETPQEALVYYCDMIKRLYPNALKCNPCTHCFFDGLTNGALKWATDPIYSSKLRELYKFLRSDEEIIKVFDLNLPG